MTDTLQTPGPREKKSTSGEKFGYPALAGGLSVLALVAGYTLMRWAPSPIETAIIVVAVVLVLLAVVGYVGSRRGHAAPFVATALILPYLLGGVMAYGSAQRAASELEGFFADDGAVASEGFEIVDENGDGVGDTDFAGTNCAQFFPGRGPYYEQCIANGGSKRSTAASEGSASPDGDGPPTEPLDGGSFTWGSGVTMSLDVVKTEPWGSTDDYCGDGSCGVSNPDDLRWVLRYDVSVPADLVQPFDASSCPGELHIANGNDEESIIGVAGDYAKDLGGRIFPGATKHGVQEYSIEQSALGQEFYIESYCGDPNFAEPAYFTGTIDK